MEATGVLLSFKGILYHGHWKPYFKIYCQHALCNAHHLRELESAWEQDKQEWATDMRDLLVQINKAGDDAGGHISATDSMKYRQRYRDPLKKVSSSR